MHVIANQCAHWCGNLPDIPETFWECHVATLLAMTKYMEIKL